VTNNRICLKSLTVTTDYFDPENGGKKSEGDDIACRLPFCRKTYVTVAPCTVIRALHEYLTDSDGTGKDLRGGGLAPRRAAYRSVGVLIRPV
jgi:hypothetical protein